MPKQGLSLEYMSGPPGRCLWRQPVVSRFDRRAHRLDACILSVPPCLGKLFYLL